MNDEQKNINEFAGEVLELTKKYGDSLPPYEIVARLISRACGIALCRAPNELVGVKTIMASIEIGISEYEQTHS